MMNGHNKREDLGPWANYQLTQLEKERDQKAAHLYRLLDPENKLGRWSPHYLQALLDLYAIEMRLDGMRVGLDVEIQT